MFFWDTLLFIGTFEKCLEMGETQSLLFIGTFEKCLKMGETQFFLFIGPFKWLRHQQGAPKVLIKKRDQHGFRYDLLDV